MTDLEICKRIAEIEGHKVSTDVRPSCGAAYVNMYPNNCYGNYSPLAKTETGKALCFDLMVKYDVRVEPSDCNAWIDNEDGYPEHEIIHHGGTLQQAICLAIIKADKENKTTWLRDRNTKTNKGK
jgi:hypothetical protein